MDYVANILLLAACFGPAVYVLWKWNPVKNNMTPTAVKGAIVWTLIVLALAVLRDYRGYSYIKTTCSMLQSELATSRDETAIERLPHYCLPGDPGSEE